MKDELPLISACLRHIKAEGITHVFGVVGGLLYPFFRAIEDDPDLEFIQAKHEEGAAFMADGFARVSGQMAIAAATSGPGATNLITGVACAFTDGIPMLVITGQASTGTLGKGASQEANREDIDIVEMFRPITKYSAFVSSAQSFSNHFRRAMVAAFSGRRGPVHLNVPVDLWNTSVPDTYFEPNSYRSLLPQICDPVSINVAIRTLLSAKYPVFLVGSGVAQSTNARIELDLIAKVINARVATTPRAKGVFPEDDTQSLGVFGSAGHQLAKDTIFDPKVDVIFTIGTSLGETSTYSWSPELFKSKKLIQLDIDPSRIGRNYPVSIPLLGDAGFILNKLRHAIDRVSESQWGYWPPSKKWDPALRDSESIPLTPQRWRAELDAVLEPDAVIFSDIGGHMLFNIHHLDISGGRKFMINLNFGSMGHGIAAPIGAAMSCPKSQIVAIVGDGCFTMNGMELLTAVDHNVPVIWIVENNNMHGVTHHCSKLLNNGVPLKSSINRRKVDVSALAAAMGLNVRKVDRPGMIYQAIRELYELKAPGLIEVVVDGSISPPLGERAKSLAGFISHER